METSITATSSYPPVLQNIDRESPVFFWRPGEGNGYLGQYFPSKFVEPETHPSHVFAHAEQYMMYHKALVLVNRSPYFTPEEQQEAESSNPHHRKADENLPEQILACRKPDQMKRLVSQRGVKFTDAQFARWEKIKFDVVCRGTRAKFSQHVKLKQQLLDTGVQELVEASKYDHVWGVGYDAANAWANKAYWGKNMLGCALMLVRQELMAEL